MLGVLVILFTAGILYHLVFAGVSWVVMGVTIACGVALSVCLVRFLREKRSGRTPRGYSMPTSHRASAVYQRMLQDELDRRHSCTPGMYSKKPKVVQSEAVVCTARDGEENVAVVLVREDGTSKVLCKHKGDCCDCGYEDILDI